MNNLLTIEDVCKLLNVKKSWIRKMIAIKKIPHLKIAGHIRFEKDKLIEWVRSKK